MQSIANNYVELQNNILNTYQSVLSRFIDDVSKSYWNNFRIPERYADVYQLVLCFLIINFSKQIVSHIKIESFCSKICGYFISQICKR